LIENSDFFHTPLHSTLP